MNTNFQNFFIHNLETDKLNIHTAKEFYSNLSTEQQKTIKQFCLWSRTSNCWISKGKAEHCNRLIDQLVEMGFAYLGQEGERKSFAEKIESKQARAENRAERAEAQAEKAELKSESLYSHAKTMASFIPFGQPILVGHHSEKKDRNYRNKIHNTFGKAFAEGDKAEYFKQKAERARATADGAKFSNPGYISLRIREAEADIRKYQRGLKGKLYESSPEREVDEATKSHFNKKIEGRTEELDFYKHCLETCGKPVFNKETLTGQKFIKVKGCWYEIVRLNPTSISVYNTSFPERSSQAKYPLKYLYTQVEEAK